MAYLVDRSRALYVPDIVAVLNVQLRKVRSRVVMKDNSLYHTLTRSKVLARQGRGPLSMRRRSPRKV